MNKNDAISGRGLLIWIIVLMLPACGGGGGSDAPPPPPPQPPIEYIYEQPADLGDGWSIQHATDASLDVPRLEAMMNDIRAGQFPYVDSIAISKGGFLVFDETIRTSTDDRDDLVGNSDPSVHAQFSITKSVTSLLVGVAIDEGYIENVDVPYLNLFPYADYDNWDERKNDITLHHVLAMQLGLEWNEFDPDYTSPDNQLNRFYREEFDFSKALLDLPIVAEPGTQFAYNTAATVSLGQAVENAAPMTLTDFGLNELMLPMSITRIEFLRTPTELLNGGSGLYARTRDVAKFGQLLLDGGTWNGERIVSEDWIAESLVPRTEVGWEDPENWDWQLEGYGYQWWLGHYEVDGTQIPTWVGWGFGGQFLVAIPSLDLVIVVNSDGYDGSDTAVNDPHALIRNYVLPAAGL
ncbi:MAG: serine hydrolase [Woeseiaceae bacterium]|nr:serine hydrolase [Woeseiaceae bacterium]